jgi:cyclic pyranopterin phosphate synthase
MTMVDVSSKPEIHREATARGRIKLTAGTIELIKQGKTEKGDPLTTAKIAGILAAKKTSEIIPLCHPLPLTSIKIETQVVDDSAIDVISIVKTKAQTGVEMEALTAVSAALLAIWDITKQYEKDAKGQYPHTTIEEIRVVSKMKRE